MFSSFVSSRHPDAIADNFFTLSKSGNNTCDNKEMAVWKRGIEARAKGIEDVVFIIDLQLNYFTYRFIIDSFRERFKPIYDILG